MICGSEGKTNGTQLKSMKKILFPVWKDKYDVRPGVFIIHYQNTDGLFFFLQISQFHILMFRTRRNVSI